MKTKFYKMKLPLFTLLAELAVIVIIFLILIISINQGASEVNELSSGGSSDDVVRGWIVIPKLLWGFFGGLSYLVLAFATITYCVIICMVLGWNILFNHINSKENIGLMILSVLPTTAFSVYVLVSAIVENNGTSYLIAIPGIILLLETIVQFGMYISSIHQKNTLVA